MLELTPPGLAHTATMVEQGSNMPIWRRIAERKIREAMEEGAFDNLAGTGLPLDLREDPFEDRELRMGHRLLRNNGFAPAWIEEARDIEASIAIARRELARGVGMKSPWRERAVRDFRARAAEINRRILGFNLKAPAASVHKCELDVDDEVKKAGANVPY